MPSETSDGLGALLSGARFGQFLSVGAIGAVFDLTVSTILSVGFEVPPEYAKLVGAEVAIVVMFVVNERWTFADHGLDGWPNTLRRFVKSNLVRSGGLAVQFLVVQFLAGLSVTVVVAGFDFWQVIPFPVAIACSLLVNYVFESLVTWQVHR